MSHIYKPFENMETLFLTKEQKNIIIEILQDKQIELSNNYTKMLPYMQNATMGKIKDLNELIKIFK